MPLQKGHRPALLFPIFAPRFAGNGSIMASLEPRQKKSTWYKRLRNKYRLVFMNDDTLEERFTFRLSKLNVFIALGTLTIILIFLTSILIAFTPLREYIPGYTNVKLQRNLYELQLKTDSVEKELERKDKFLENLRRVINGGDLNSEIPAATDTMRRYGDIRINRSNEDSLLRVEVESQARYSLYRIESSGSALQKKTSLGNVLFFVPLKGVLTNDFDPARQHYGVDIVAKENEAIKAVLDGTVIFSDWTVETGYVITIQHIQNVVSVYKHNSALLKRQGEHVNAGEPIAIIGQSGELTSGPHLHFEIWNEGNPINPQDYISF
jgi:murein DD-endopeptidase MepM/ murein hydrolase activator NlpD